MGEQAQAPMTEFLRAVDERDAARQDAERLREALERIETDAYPEDEGAGAKYQRWASEALSSPDREAR